MMLVALVVGTTASYFTDSEESTSNVARVINNWYDFAWHWRKPITINNGGGALTNYQVKVVINTQELISAGKMQSNGNDIRFTTSNGMTSIDYWIESGINTASTVIWVEVPSVPAGNSTTYMYYGNTSATAASSGDNTFLFFDDFLGTSLDTTNKWDIINPSAGSYSVNGGLLTIQSTGDWWGTFDTSLYVVSKSSFNFAYAAESLINQIGDNSYNRLFGLRASSATNSRMSVLLVDNDSSHITDAYRSSDGGNANWDGENSGTPNPGNNKVARFERNGDTVSSYYNNSLVNTRTVTNWNLVKVGLTDSFFFGTQQANIFDWIFVRKYTSPEPAMTGIGAEE